MKKSPLHIKAFMIILSTLILFFLLIYIIEYKPKKVETIHTSKVSDHLPDSIKILCWNIGYGGLGANMDFFYDGGTKVRDTKEQTIENLGEIISLIKKENADIVLLQEVDKCSKRTYRIDQLELLRKEFPGYHIYFAYNYNSPFVPKPLKEPIGKVESGVVIMTKYIPKEVIRYQYPSKFPFPISAFNLKRCLLCAKFSDSSGKEIVVANTHNTAYDTGNMRQKEIMFLEQLFKEYSDNNTSFVIGGDWNQYPPEYIPDPEELDTSEFMTIKLDDSNLSKYSTIKYHKGEKTLRHLNIPYTEESVLTVTDYFIHSKNISSSEAKVIPLNFKNSDHNPIKISISLINKSENKSVTT